MNYEVLVFDDASTDGTPAVLNQYRLVLPLRILKEGHRAGYAGAVQRLLQEALERTSYPKRGRGRSCFRRISRRTPTTSFRWSRHWRVGLTS